MCDFSSLWIEMRVLKRAPWWNILLHSTQMSGFPPLCVDMWPFRWGFAWIPYCIQLFIPFLSTVSHHVTLQMPSTSERYLTLVLFLPNMNKKVPFQTPSLVESIIALITIIWFFSTLCKKMYLHLVWAADFFWCIHDIWILSNTKILQFNNPWLAQFEETGN